MLLCKQEERNLKRIEGDILKKESNLKMAMQSYKNGMVSLAQFSLKFTSETSQNILTPISIPFSNPEGE